MTQTQTTEIDSDAAAAVKSPTKRTIGGLTHAEARARGQDAHRGRLERLRERLSARAFEAVTKVPPKYAGRHVKALLGELSAIGAIKAKCEECVGFEEVPVSVGGCKASTCPIHAYRPYQPKT